MVNAELTTFASIEANRLRNVIYSAFKASTFEAVKEILAQEVYPESQGPEFTTEQIQAMQLRGSAP